MRVIILAMKYFPASGGSATYAHNLAMGLHKQGCDVLLLAPHSSRPNSDHLQPFKIRRMHATSEVFFGVRTLVAAGYLILSAMKFWPHVVWASAYAGCRVLGITNFMGYKSVGTIHGGGVHRGAGASFTSRLLNRFGSLFLNRADAVVTISEEAKKLIDLAFQPSKIVHKSEVQVIYNGIDWKPDRFVSKTEALKQLPALRNKIVLLTVGRLVKAKGHDTVLESISILRDKIPNLHYVIVGEGAEKQNISKRIHELNLDDMVTMAGYVSEATLEMYYGLADVFVMAGRPTKEFIEGFGLVFIEAGIRGKAVIGTRVGGIPEAISDHETGLLVPPNNPSAFASAIEQLVSSIELRERLAHNALPWIESHFSLQAMGKKNLALLNSLSVS